VRAFQVDGQNADAFGQRNVVKDLYEGLGVDFVVTEIEVQVFEVSQV
jgi:hypothetical protein